jgi:pimeloyl-ACP methyl ester carboxylesterase
MRPATTGEPSMKSWEKILAVAGICMLAMGAVFIHRASLPRRNVVVVAGGCHTPVTILEPPAGVSASGSVILLHGLGANRRTMTYLGTDFVGYGFRAYLLDLPGHGDNTDAFSFAKAQECADLTVESLVRDGTIDPRKTILLGHSMGGAIAVRMADVVPLAATIALSPAPMTAPRRMPSNLLVFSSQYDLGILQRQAAALAAAAGGERIAPQDFAEQRAFSLQFLPHATHTTPLIDRGVAHRSEEWAMQALFPAVDARTVVLNLDLATYDTFSRGRFRLAGAVLGLVGLFLMFPVCATITAISTGPPLTEIFAAAPSPVLAIAEQAVCALASVLVLAVFVPLKFIHLYNGDYLASLLLISGGLMVALNWKFAKSSFAPDWRLIAASILAIAVVLAAGAWFNWQLGDLWLNASRWLRFAAILPAALIFCFAEEVTLGPISAGKARAMRFLLSLVMRLELWLACVLAYYTLDNGQVLIGVLVAGLAAFSVLQRLATDAFRARTGSATAAAAFGAILAAWFIVAVFPLR